jgi:putative heme-binding domain-containing protein
VTSGSEFGWRNGAGKWPAYYPDSLPGVVDIGPGSPTGICFGYGAKFPFRYQNALFICDWSYGKMYAVHLKPNGSSYLGDFEEFLGGNPLPLTDVVINPVDGAMYFAIGGRKTKSGLYRVTYVGPETTPSFPSRVPFGTFPRNSAPSTRRLIEEGKQDAWTNLGDADRFIRFAARTALEHIEPKHWAERALNEENPARALAALLALVRVSADDPQHHPKDARPIDEALKGRILDSLARFDWNKLDETQRIELLRIYQILFVRMGVPNESQRQRVLSLLDPHYPSKSRNVNAMLCEIMVYLEAPSAAKKTLAMLAAGPTQEEQMEYAKSLRVLKTGWTLDQRKEYFSWFSRAKNFAGGMSFQGFMDNIKKDAIATLSPEEQVALKPILEAPPDSTPVVAQPPRPFVKKWTVADLDSAISTKLTGRDFDRGRQMFGAANCFSCHRFANEGGSQGPDLTMAAGRFSPRDLLESIIEPSKEISDQYASVVINTIDGKLITGRIINLDGNNLSILTNMLEPNKLTKVDVRRIETQDVCKVSMMPEGALDSFKEDEILDLLAYLLSKGQREGPMFRK